MSLLRSAAAALALLAAAGPAFAGGAPLKAPLPVPAPRSAAAAVAAPVATPAQAAADARGTAKFARPPAGGPDLLALVAADSAKLAGESGLSGHSGFALIDLATGRVLAAQSGDRPFPPASTAKAITALYAIETLGAESRFATELRSAGPLDARGMAPALRLVGGADPELDTDDLRTLLDEARRAGLKGVSGPFLVDGRALPEIARIDPEQPEHAAYNPSVGGLNLNYNRAQLAWSNGKGGPDLRMLAAARRNEPEIPTLAAAIGDAGGDVVKAGGLVDGAERWTVAASALKTEGRRWLPVRRPALYAADAMRALAAGEGLALPAPTPETAALAHAAPMRRGGIAGGPESGSAGGSGGGASLVPLGPRAAKGGTAVASLVPAGGSALDAAVASLSGAAAPEADGILLARHESDPLLEVVRDMLRWSTNLTAETIGMAASNARGAPVRDLGESGARMAGWMVRRAELAQIDGLLLRNHSGLSADARLTPLQMARFLRAAAMRDASGAPIPEAAAIAAAMASAPGSEGAPGVAAGWTPPGPPPPRGALWPVMRPVALGSGKDAPPKGVQAVAKTGTLLFARGLAGYLDAASGRRLVFAIYSEDLERRARAEDLERAPGSSAWVARATSLERRLLNAWARRF